MLGGAGHHVTGLSPSAAWSVATDRLAWRALRPVDGQAQGERERLLKEVLCIAKSQTVPLPQLLLWSNVHCMLSGIMLHRVHRPMYAR